MNSVYMGTLQKNSSDCSLRRSKRLLGQILTDGDFIRYDDLDRVLKDQKKTNRMLGEMLVEIGLIDSLDLKAVLSVSESLASLDEALNLAAGVRRHLGELFIQAKHMTAEQLDLALQVQKRTGQKLGEVMIDLGFVTDGELDAVLKFQQNQAIEEPAPGSLRLGEILVAAHFISRTQLKDALSRQKASEKKIGEILVEEGYISHHELLRGLNLQGRLLTAVLVAILSLAPASKIYSAEPVPPDVSAGTAATKITESLQTHTSMKIVYQTTELVLNNTDIIRGYVDIPLGAHIEIQNNNLAGYLVVFAGLRNPVKEVIIQGLGKEALISSDGGWIAQPYHGRDPLTVELSYRFILSENAQPGTYIWPLKISVSPIIQV